MVAKDNESMIREDIMSSRGTYALGGSLIVGLMMWMAAISLVI